jgi:hypothetical protein
MICDNCGKQSEDICGDLNWISINWISKNGLTVSVSGGRPEGKGHQAKSCKQSNKNVDFCSTECMLRWMELNPVKPEPKNSSVVLWVRSK